MSNVKRIEGNGRMSRVVDCGDIVFFSGMTADARQHDVAVQTEEVLAKIDSYLQDTGLTRQDLVSAQIWLKHIRRDFASMNAVWDAWVVKGHEPTRATVGAELATDDLLVEIAVIARRT